MYPENGKDLSVEQDRSDELRSARLEHSMLEPARPLGADQDQRCGDPPGGGKLERMTGWLMARLRGPLRPKQQLSVIERITLAPRQSLTLVEAAGQRLLVATSADGTPAFYRLGAPAIQRPESARHRSSGSGSGSGPARQWHAGGMATGKAQNRRRGRVSC
jgi:hypothetical protein